MSRYLGRVKADMFEKNSRYFIYLFVSFWKLVLFLVLFITLAPVFGRVTDTNTLFSNFSISFDVSKYSIVDVDGNDVGFGHVETNLPAGVIVTQVRGTFP